MSFQMFPNKNRKDQRQRWSWHSLPTVVLFTAQPRNGCVSRGHQAATIHNPNHLWCPACFHMCDNLDTRKTLCVIPLARSSLVLYRSQSRPLKDGCHRWATYPRLRKERTNLQHCHGDAVWDFGLLWHTAADDAGTLGCRPSRWTKLPLQRWFPNCNEGLWRFQATSTTVSTVIYSHHDLTMTSTQPLPSSKRLILTST